MKTDSLKSGRTRWWWKAVWLTLYMYMMPLIILKPGRCLITRSSASLPPSGKEDSWHQHLPSASLSLHQATPCSGQTERWRGLQRDHLSKERERSASPAQAEVSVPISHSSSLLALQGSVHLQSGSAFSGSFSEPQAPGRRLQSLGFTVVCSTQNELATNLSFTAAPWEPALWHRSCTRPLPTNIPGLA